MKQYFLYLTGFLVFNNIVAMNSNSQQLEKLIFDSMPLDKKIALAQQSMDNENVQLLLTVMQNNRDLLKNDACLINQQGGPLLFIEDQNLDSDVSLLDFYTSLLNIAVMRRSKDIVQIILKHLDVPVSTYARVKLDEKSDEHYDHPLSFALENKDPEITTLLLEKDADPQGIRQAFVRICLNEGYEQMLKPYKPYINIIFEKDIFRGTILDYVNNQLVMLEEKGDDENREFDKNRLKKIKKFLKEHGAKTMQNLE